MEPRISILLPTFNCQESVRQTLESVKWADEILVVDSFSIDQTIGVCREYGARIVQHEYINSAKQKNWAAPQCRHEWVLQIDSDEILEAGLREEIEHAVATAPPEVHAFRMPRLNNTLGVWMRRAGGYPDHQMRLFRRDQGRWAEREVHAHLQVAGQTGTLEHHILHFGGMRLTQAIRNLDRYTRYEADELRKQGKRFRWHDLVVHPWLIFFQRYLWQQGFRDGWAGLVICAYFAMYDFLLRAKLWEMEHFDLKQSPRGRWGGG